MSELVTITTQGHIAHVKLNRPEKMNALNAGMFEAMLPILTILGRQVLHTGEIGSASKLKVMTNYLATTHLVALAEALTTMAAAGLDLATTYEAIRISSGNSFVHETESQVILNGSRDINFTMDLVLKDIGLFQSIAEDHGVPLDLSYRIEVAPASVSIVHVPRNGPARVPVINAVADAGRWR